MWEKEDGEKCKGEHDGVRMKWKTIRAPKDICNVFKSCGSLVGIVYRTLEMAIAMSHQTGTTVMTAE